MVLEEIKADLIPNWEFGDVCIKSFSFGDKLKLSEIASDVKSDGKDFVVVPKKDFSISEINLFLLSAGLKWVKPKDSVGFVIRPEWDLKAKEKVVYDFDFDSAQFLLKEILRINQVDKSLEDVKKKD